MKRRRAYTSKKWRVSVKVLHISGIFKRPSIQHFVVTSRKPITAVNAIKKFKRQHPSGSTVSFEPRTPRQRHASKVCGAKGAVTYEHGISARAIVKR